MKRYASTLAANADVVSIEHTGTGYRVAITTTCGQVLYPVHNMYGAVVEYPEPDAAIRAARRITNTTAGYNAFWSLRDMLRNA